MKFIIQNSINSISFRWFSCHDLFCKIYGPKSFHPDRISCGKCSIILILCFTLYEKLQQVAIPVLWQTKAIKMCNKWIYVCVCMWTFKIFIRFLWCILYGNGKKPQWIKQKRRRQQEQQQQCSQDVCPFSRVFFARREQHTEKFR